MGFTQTDPIALKIVFWINVVTVALLVISGFFLAWTFILWIPLVVFAIAFIYWKFLTSALRQKKKYSYWLNIIFHGFTIISFIIALFTIGIKWADSVRIINVLAIYLLLRKEVRTIFISGSQQKLNN